MTDPKPAPLTDADLAVLRDLEAKATPGKWIVSRQRRCIDTGQMGSDGVIYDGYSIEPADFDAEAWPADAAFVAAARNALPALLAELAASRESHAAMVAERDALLERERRLVEQVQIARRILDDPENATPGHRRARTIHELAQLVITILDDTDAALARSKETTK